MNNCNKFVLIKNLSTATGFSANYSKKIINDFIEILIMCIKSGNCNLKNIGSFKIIKKNQRIGINPKTKKEYVIDSRKSISFAPSKKILQKLNKNL